MSKPGNYYSPEMVVVPAGHFLMGSRDDEGWDSEHPQHEVTIAYPFAVGNCPALC
jgi:formylglycine-generating enzyme required for sulfatase activity